MSQPALAASPFDAVPRQRSAYGYQSDLQVRWGDFDQYAHLNNVAYYRFFETGLVTFFMATGIDIGTTEALPFAAETACRYLRPVVWPCRITFGLATTRLGRSSVTYGLALFRDDETDPSAIGYWVHVFVERGAERPIPIPDTIRAALVGLATPGA